MVKEIKKGHGKGGVSLSLNLREPSGFLFFFRVTLFSFFSFFFYLLMEGSQFLSVGLIPFSPEESRINSHITILW